MATEQDKFKVVRFVDDVINSGNWDRVDEYVDPDAIDHTLPPGMPNTFEATRALITAVRAALPDIKYTVTDIIAEGDLIAQHATGEGTMTGSLLGVPPTGKHAQWDELHLLRVRDGKIVEHWGNIDQMSMMMQLGLAPMPGS